MALAGMHVLCTGATASNSNGPLPVNDVWSQLVAGPGPFSTAVGGNSTLALVRCEASADSYIASSAVSAADAFTKAQDVAAGPRHLVRAGAPYDFYCAPGRFLGWALA